MLDLNSIQENQISLEQWLPNLLGCCPPEVPAHTISAPYTLFSHN